MENNDHRTEQQVWQRVRASREEAPPNDLRQLQREALELAAVYWNLASQLTGKPQSLLKRLHAGKKPMRRLWRESQSSPGWAGKASSSGSRERRIPVGCCSGATTGPAGA